MSLDDYIHMNHEIYEKRENTEKTFLSFCVVRVFRGLSIMKHLKSFFFDLTGRFSAGGWADI